MRLSPAVMIAPSRPSTSLFARLLSRDVRCAAPMVIYLLVFLIAPIFQLLKMSFLPHGQWGLANYTRLFAAPVYLDVLAITFKTAAWTTLLAVIGGYPVAYLTTIASPRFKSSLLFWILLPFWTSFLVRTFAWIVLLGRNGVINQWLQAMGMTHAPANMLYNFGAVLVGMVHAMMPIAILTMMSVMANIDRTLPRAALTLGARPARAFWTVYFPLSLPGVAAAAIMVFVTALGFFITPALLGGPHETMITQLIIDQVLQTLNWGFAGAISLLLLVTVLIVFVLYDRCIGLSTLTGGEPTSTASGYRSNGLARRAGFAVLESLATLCDAIGTTFSRLLPRRRGSSGKHPALWAIAIVTLVFLIAPTLLMIPVSFTSASAIDWPPQGFSLQWYGVIAHAPTWGSAALRSLIIGIATGILSMLIGVPAAFLLVRSKVRWRALFFAFALLPMIVPRMILAVGLFYLLARLQLIGSIIGMVLGHTTVALPYVVVTMTAILKNYDVRLDAAAASLGANRWTTLRHVTFPILGAGFVSSFLFAFVTSFDELTIALFVTSGLNSTLPKQFWDEVTLTVSPTIAAVSTCLFVFSALVIWCANRLRARGTA
jgi:putative spermidine/putrescine transport system permease protein